MKPGRKQERKTGLNGMRTVGIVCVKFVISPNSIIGCGSPRLLAGTGLNGVRNVVGIVFVNLKGSKMLVWPDSDLSALLLAEAAYTPVPSPTITARANAPNRTLDLSLPFSFPIHMSLIIISLSFRANAHNRALHLRLSLPFPFPIRMSLIHNYLLIVFLSFFL